MGASAASDGADTAAATAAAVGDEGEQEEEEEYLVEDFREVPEEAFPDYGRQVRKIMSLTELKDNLHRHAYWSFTQFAKDFYTMLNNVQVVVNNPQLAKDCATLAEVFEALRQRSLLQSAAALGKDPSRAIQARRVRVKTHDFFEDTQSSADVEAVAPNEVEVKTHDFFEDKSQSSAEAGPPKEAKEEGWGSDSVRCGDCRDMVSTKI